MRLEVADAYVALKQARAAYEAAVQSRVLQEQSVDVEQATFDVGLATNYLVIQYQTYLAQAQSTKLPQKGVCKGEDRSGSSHCKHSRSESNIHSGSAERSCLPGFGSEPESIGEKL